MLNLFKKDLAIDLGTANTLVYTKKNGMLIREPSVVAVRNNNNRQEILAVGEEAKKMIGRTSGNILAIRPMKDGVIWDFEMTAVMLSHFISKACKRKRLFKPRTVICIPSGVTSVEKKSVIDVALQAKAGEVYLIEESMAAAIGADMPVSNPAGNMIVDIGGGTTDIAIISLEGIVVSNSIRVAGDEMTEAIIHHMKNNYNILLGENKAEEIKINFGSAFFTNYSEIQADTRVDICGRDAMTGLPKTIEINCEELQGALASTVNQIVSAVKVVLDQTPAELCGDIMDKGIVMTGGGSLLRGLDKTLSNRLGVPAYLVDNPLECTAIGAWKVVQSLDKYNRFLIGFKS
ncbi:rod shape-determining protein [Orenia metallireducens]|uniref:rod shape-determining protein n=1 Tax=Orenia metallireducens TaxID=1413210 RepID=UPI000A74AD61|nr:rod shape-determining protein [Orenia metallireducens]